MNSRVLGTLVERKEERRKENIKDARGYVFLKRPKSYNHLVLQYNIMSREKKKGTVLKKHR